MFQEDSLPRALDPMYQGMSRENVVAKRALFANLRAQVHLNKNLDTYNNICREEVMGICYNQRKLCKDYRQRRQRMDIIDRVRSAPSAIPTTNGLTPAPPLVQTPPDEKFRSHLMSRSSTMTTDSDDSDNSDVIADVKSRNQFISKEISPYKQSDSDKKYQTSFFSTKNDNTIILDKVNNLNKSRPSPWKPPKWRKPRPQTAMDLIKAAKPLSKRSEVEEIDQNRLRTSSYYRRVTSPSLKGLVSNELAVYFRRMQIKV